MSMETACQKMFRPNNKVQVTGLGRYFIYKNSDMKVFFNKAFTVLYDITI
jgi:hypothetical protein